MPEITIVYIIICTVNSLILILKHNSVEKLYKDLASMSNQALYPFSIAKNMTLSLDKTFATDLKSLYHLLFIEG